MDHNSNFFKKSGSDFYDIFLQKHNVLSKEFD